MTWLPSSRNLRAKASPMPAERPVMRTVRPLRFIRFLSCPLSVATRVFLLANGSFSPPRVLLFGSRTLVWDDAHNPNGAKKTSEAGQKVVADAGQHSFPVGRLGQKTRNRHGARHRTKDDEEVALPLFRGASRHEHRPRIRKLLDQAGSSFLDSQFGAGNLRRQRYNGTARARMIAVLG